MLKELLLKITTKKELSEEEKHQKFLNEIYSKKNQSHKKKKTILFLFVGTYLFFFTSKLWFPVQEQSSAPKPWTVYSLGVHQATLVRYDYCEKQKRIEIEFDLSESEYEEGYYRYAVTENGKELPSEVVYESDSSLIINITGIKRSTDDIYFSLGFMRDEDDFDQIKFTYPINSLRRVSDLTPKTAIEYQIQRIEITIDLDKKEIKALEKDNQKQQELIDGITKRNQELSNNLEYKTEDQKAEVEEQIQNNVEQKDNAAKQIAENNAQILSLREEIAKAEDLQRKIKEDE